MKPAQPFTIIDYRDSPPARELKMHEVGEGLFVCVLEDCDWSGSVPIFAPPSNALAEVFGEGTMTLQAEQHHTWEVERMLYDHYTEHKVDDFLRTVVGLREEIDLMRVHAMAPPLVCGRSCIDSDEVIDCERAPEHEGEHAGIDEQGDFRTWAL